MIRLPAGSWRLQVLRVVSLMIIAAGAVGFFAPVFLPDPAIELPNTAVADAAIFADGTIATANPFFERIQIFSADGRYLRGWSPNANGGWFCLDIAGKQLLSYSARGDLLERYDVRGDLLSSRPFDSHGSLIDCSLDPKVSSIRSSYVGGAILLKNGKTVSLEQKWWHYIVPGSFYSWVVFALGLILNPDWRRGILTMWRRSRTGATMPNIAKP